MGVEPAPGGRPAGAQRRRDRQHSRARRASATRARKDLIDQFGSVEAALDRAAEVERKMYRESLQNNRERILLSKRLATIETAVPIEFSMEMVQAQEPDVAALKPVYKELEFHSQLKELGPSEDTRRARLSGARIRRKRWTRWLAAIPAGSAGRGGDREIRRGRVCAGYDRPGVEARAKRARAAAAHRATCGRCSKMPRCPRSPAT